MFDVCIIGGGVAGLSAALFTTRRGLKTLLITKDLGGQTASTAEIENYPGIDRVEGPDLVDRFRVAAEKFGCEIVYGTAISCEQNDAGFVVTTGQDSYQAHTCILAFGKTPRDLGIPGEREFFGKGVSTRVTIDGPNCRDKIVAVIGGGNSALDASARLALFAEKVYLIHRRNDFRGEQILQDRVERLTNIEKLAPYGVTEIRGSAMVTSIILEHLETHETREVILDGVFPAIGFEPRTQFLKDFVDLDEQSHVIIDPTCATSRAGVFAAGDITTVPYQQIVISAGEGAKAALSAYQYLQKKLGKRPVRVDWGFL